MSLQNTLNATANASRLNAIDAAFRGNPYEGSNFKANFAGYNDDGFALVRYQDRVYSAQNIAGRSARGNQTVLLRVAKKKMQINY